MSDTPKIVKHNFALFREAPKGYLKCSFKGTCASKPGGCYHHGKHAPDHTCKAECSFHLGATCVPVEE